MKILFLGDLHLISPEDPSTDLHLHRAHFAKAWPSFRDIIRQIRDEAPDLLVSVGDLVDWYSDENRDFAKGLLDETGTPWVFTPGNHDFLSPTGGEPNPGKMAADWGQAGLETGNRVMDTDGVRLLLMDSHDSGVSSGTRDWLFRELREDVPHLLVTHVPLEHPHVRRDILEIEPQRDLGKYVQSKAPGLYADCLRERVDLVVSGHLHFPMQTRIGRTRMQLLPLGLRAWEKSYPSQGSFATLDTCGLRLQNHWDSPHG